MGQHKYNPTAIVANVKYDKKTLEWFGKHPFEETTVACCPDCGFYYKPMLGHKCEKWRGKK